MSRTKWTRKCVEFKRITEITAAKHGITPKQAEGIVMRYLLRCKQLLITGHRVQIPGILYMRLHKSQLKKLRKFMTYKEKKKRYGDKAYFKKHVLKTSNKDIAK